MDVSRQSGGQISDGYVSRIENGVILNVTPKKLAALARGLHIAEDTLFAIARGRKVSTSAANEEQLLAYYRGLPPENQTDLLTLAQALHRERGIEKAVKRPKAA